MMKYAKLINGNLSLAPNPIKHNGLWYGNPPAEILRAEGYKPVQYTEAPTPEPGFVAVPGWEETPEAIVQIWDVVEQPITEDEALVRYSNELTGASDKNLVEAAETLIKTTMEVK